MTTETSKTNTLTVERLRKNASAKGSKEPYFSVSDSSGQFIRGNASVHYGSRSSLTSFEVTTGCLENGKLVKVKTGSLTPTALWDADAITYGDTFMAEIKDDNMRTAVKAAWSTLFSTDPSKTTFILDGSSPFNAFCSNPEVKALRSKGTAIQ